jgi:hypothetical protein
MGFGLTNRCRPPLVLNVLLTVVIAMKVDLSLAGIGYKKISRKKTMRLEPLMLMTATTASPIDIGSTHKGHRQIFNVARGEFTGDRLSGKLAESGGEWLLIEPDGFAQVDVKVILQTADGANIYMHYGGVIEFSDKVASAALGETKMEFGDIHFVTQPRFETGDKRYQWLNNLVAIAEGRIIEGAVQYRVFEVIPSP